jgi:hypothetical protein
MLLQTTTRSEGIATRSGRGPEQRGIVSGARCSGAADEDWPSQRGVFAVSAYGSVPAQLGRVVLAFARLSCESQRPGEREAAAGTNDSQSAARWLAGVDPTAVRFRVLRERHGRGAQRL